MDVQLKVNFKYSIPFIIHLAVVLPLAYIHDLNVLEFLGLNLSWGITLTLLTSLALVIYDSWLGVLLGHNVDLRKMGKWAVVTGATDGIGYAYCRELAKLGLNVVLMSRTLDKLQKCAALLEAEFGIRTKVIEIDFSGDIDVYDAVDKELEGMDIGTLINNVGMTYSRPTFFHHLPNSKQFIHDILNINTLAVTMMVRAVLPGMVSRRRGVVVNVGSVASAIPLPWYSLYGASKTYMDKFTYDMGNEYSDLGIIFQYQMPGYVTTKLSKIRFSSLGVPTPEQYAVAGIKSIGLQRRRTAVWFSHRALVHGLNLCFWLCPESTYFYVRMTMRSFWLFAKKREFEKLNYFFNEKVV